MTQVQFQPLVGDRADGGGDAAGGHRGDRVLLAAEVALLQVGECYLARALLHIQT